MNKQPKITSTYRNHLVDATRAHIKKLQKLWLTSVCKCDKLRPGMGDPLPLARHSTPVKHMKKTLTLAALALSFAASAFAAEPILDITDAFQSSYTAADTIGGAALSTVDEGNAALTAVFQLDWAAMTESTTLSSVAGPWLHATVSQRNAGFGFVKSTAEDGTVDFSIKTMVGTATRATTIGSLSSYVNESGKLVLTMNLGPDGMALYALGGDAEAGYTKVLDTQLQWTNDWGSNNTLPYDSLNIGSIVGVVDHMLVFNSSLSDAEVVSTMKAIPEPATATLSLLALAGLAARRRRK